MVSPQAEQIRAFMKSAVASVVQTHLPVETRRAQFEALRAQIPLLPMCRSKRSPQGLLQPKG